VCCSLLKCVAEQCVAEQCVAEQCAAEQLQSSVLQLKRLANVVDMQQDPQEHSDLSQRVQDTATTHCNNTLQQHTAITHCNNTLQQHTATHCNALQCTVL